MREREASVSLLEESFDVQSLQAVRHRVRSCLVAAGLDPERVESYTFAINEGMINAIMHGGGSGDVTLDRVDGALVAAVEDRLPTVPFALPTEVPPPSSPGGRGLWLVSHCCDDVRVEAGERGLRLVLKVQM